MIMFQFMMMGIQGPEVFLGWHTDRSLFRRLMIVW